MTVCFSRSVSSQVDQYKVILLLKGVNHCAEFAYFVGGV